MNKWSLTVGIHALLTTPLKKSPADSPLSGQPIVALFAYPPVLSVCDEENSFGISFFSKIYRSNGRFQLAFLSIYPFRYIPYNRLLSKGVCRAFENVYAQIPNSMDGFFSNPKSRRGDFVCFLHFFPRNDKNSGGQQRLCIGLYSRSSRKPTNRFYTGLRRLGKNKNLPVFTDLFWHTPNQPPPAKPGPTKSSVL